MKQSLWQHLLNPTGLIRDERSESMLRQESLYAYKTGFILLCLMGFTILLPQAVFNTRQFSSLVCIVICFSFCLKTLLHCLSGTLEISDKYGGRFHIITACVCGGLAFSAFIGMAASHLNKIFLWDLFGVGVALLYLLYHKAYARYLKTQVETWQGPDRKDHGKRLLFTGLLILYFVPSLILGILLSSDKVRNWAEQTVAINTPPEVLEINEAVKIFKSQTSYYLDIYAPVETQDGIAFILHQLQYGVPDRLLTVNLDDTEKDVWAAELELRADDENPNTLHYVDGTWYNPDEVPYTSAGNIPGRERLPASNHSISFSAIEEIRPLHVASIQSEMIDNHKCYTVTYLDSYIKEQKRFSAKAMGIATSTKDQAVTVTYELDEENQLVQVIYRETGIVKRTKESYVKEIINRVHSIDPEVVQRELDSQCQQPHYPNYS